MIRSDEILDDHLTVREVSRMYGLYAKVGLPVFNFVVGQRFVMEVDRKLIYKTYENNGK